MHSNFETQSDICPDHKRNCPDCKVAMAIDNATLSVGNGFGCVMLTWSCPECDEIFMEEAASTFGPLEKI